MQTPRRGSNCVPITLPTDLETTITQVLQLESCDPGDPVAFWTWQHPKVVETLQESGIYLASEDISFDKPWKQPAYHWMIEQMRQRGLQIPNGHVPIWGFFSHPPARDCPNWTDRPGDKLLFFHVPRGDSMTPPPRLPRKRRPAGVELRPHRITSAVH